MSSFSPPSDRRPPAVDGPHPDASVEPARRARPLLPRNHLVFLVGNPEVPPDAWRRIVETVFPRRAPHLAAILGSLRSGGSILVATVSREVAETKVDDASRLAEAMGVPASLRFSPECRSVPR